MEKFLWLVGHQSSDGHLGTMAVDSAPTAEKFEPEMRRGMTLLIVDTACHVFNFDVSFSFFSILTDPHALCLLIKCKCANNTIQTNDDLFVCYAYLIAHADQKV